MNRDQYSYVAEQLKESIIQDYLKKHPDVSRADIVTKTVNGRVIVETVTNAFSRVSERAKQEKFSSPGDKKALEMLNEEADERYQRMQESVSSCRSMVDWLFDWQFSGFDEEKKQTNSAFLDAKEEQIDRRSIDLLYVKKKFADAMQSKSKAPQSVIKVMTLEYVNCLLDQLKAQADIYNKEIELGGFFSSSVKRFIADNIDALENSDEKILKYVGMTVAFLQKNIIKGVHVSGEEDHKKLSESLDRLDEQLRYRREQYEQIKNLIQVIEKMIAALQDDSFDPPQEKTSHDKPQEKPRANQSAQRMVNTKRRGRR